MANIFKSKYTGEQIEEILDKANNVTDITPNPEAEATEELQKITIGSTTFSIPKGTTVEGNPSEDATEELTKLKVGDTVFSIPQGSGGNANVYLHIYNVEFSKSGVSAYVNLYFVNNNPNAYSDFNSIPSTELNTIVTIDATNHSNNTPMYQCAVTSAHKFFARYWSGTSPNFASATYGEIPYSIWNSDNVYDMNGNLIDSNGSGH